jgi:hypothetical protein
MRYSASAVNGWWNWPLEKIAEAVPILCSKDDRELYLFCRRWSDE